MADSYELPTVLADGVNALAVHNGVVRVQLMRLGVDGKPQPCAELHLPLSAVASIIEALRKVQVA
ncbi:MAG: hypothetical protein JNL87_06755 [Burkholderiaceae bacterium]|nr:hypothetical protein [Burkholderiaceae bacterium]